MTWLYNDQEVTTPPDDAIGFVYLISNLLDGRKYIGKKLFMFSKTRYKTVTLKSGVKKKRKIKEKIDSDWRDYWSSSEELKRDVMTLGNENFKREILYFCKSKAECSYREAKEQFSRNVLESTDYYNGQISIKVHGSHIIKLFKS